LVRLLRAAGLPAPQTNVRVGGYEVDFYWPRARLVVELDGWAYHSSREASIGRPARRPGVGKLTHGRKANPESFIPAGPPAEYVDEGSGYFRLPTL
jgi:hypothetical protein